MWILTNEEKDLHRLDTGENVWRCKKYTFRQSGYEDTVDLEDYSSEDILDMIEPFGLTGDPTLDFYQDDNTGDSVPLSTVAECIFESMIDEEERRENLSRGDLF